MCNVRSGNCYDTCYSPSRAKALVMLNPRLRLYEKKLMHAELELDGLNTHMNTKVGCHLHDTDINDKVNEALQEVRGVIALIRNDMQDRQWTLTTRGGSNRHPELPWDFNIRKKDWICVCEKAK